MFLFYFQTFNFTIMYVYLLQNENVPIQWSTVSRKFKFKKLEKISEGKYSWKRNIERLWIHKKISRESEGKSWY